MGRNRKGLRLVTVCLIAALAATLGACGGGGGGGDGDNPSAPNAPANLAAVTASTTQIDLAWTDQATGENGFEVVRGTDQLFTNPVSTIVSANTTSFRDSGLAPSSTYYYRVRSYGSGGSSAYSNTAAATTFTVSTVAGGDGNSTDGTSGTGDSTDGTGATARFNYPYGVTTDGTSLYVADTLNHTIRKVDMTTGTVTTLAGSPTVTGSSDSTDGTGATARFNYPYGIVTNGTVNYVYVADTLNHSIRRVDKWTGAVDTLVGKSGVRGNADGNTLTATFNEPEGIALVGASTLYVADTLNHTIRQINISARSAYTFAGSALVTGSTDSIGTAARFNQPAGIAYDGAGALYVADSRNHTIRKIDIATGSVTTVAGTAGVPGSLNGNGTAALFNQPSGVTVSGSNLYVTDTMNHTIRSIEVSTATSTVTLLSGQTGTAGYVVGAAADSQYNRPFGIVSSGSTLYVADTFNHEIRSVDPADGSSDTLAGSGPASTSASVFNLAHGITIDVNGGNLYVANNSNNNILAVNIATGQTTTIAGSRPMGLTCMSPTPPTMQSARSRCQHRRLQRSRDGTTRIPTAATARPRTGHRRRYAIPTQPAQPHASTAPRTWSLTRPSRRSTFRTPIITSSGKWISSPEP
jgi:DNA-binding beta-propeller fold protein YncE